MRRSTAVWIMVVVVSLVMALKLTIAIRDARRVALWMNGRGCLKQLALALHNYHTAHGCFPPAYLADASGQPMHSWRVLVLPYVEEQALYQQYDFTKAWDDPVNLRLVDQMPRVFHMPSEVESDRFTNVVAVTGPGTAFQGSEAKRIEEFTDGIENTIVLTEIANSNLLWLEPRDIDVEKSVSDNPGPEDLTISSSPWRDPCVLFADGNVNFSLTRKATLKVIQSLSTIQGGESMNLDEANKEGYLADAQSNELH
ncbi:hypothetical protein CA13_01570 [Planctomycetes bacterium CA13]|uniref:DUF1559 domain-containing protein n=1 Tax=Novipirellula herctigrandis TaxID=2527986 RepID=A0A5C5YVA0_9BACT|nr:hypothetical protein CA13_01570 [Planctomycetes bacterium CA13]